MRKLCILYEVKNTNFPVYLNDILYKQEFPERSRYYNKTIFKTFACNSKRFKLSFFPSTIRDWNCLDPDIKLSKSKIAFKNKLNNKIRPKKKSYFGININEEITYITTLRMGLSPLRAHKFKYNFADTSDPLCRLCKVSENTEHYLLRCISYKLSRVTLMQNISNILGYDILALPNKKIIKILLYGVEGLDDNKNTNILNEVTTFIAISKWLDKI